MSSKVFVTDWLAELVSSSTQPQAPIAVIHELSKVWICVIRIFLMPRKIFSLSNVTGYEPAELWSRTGGIVDVGKDADEKNNHSICSTSPILQLNRQILSFYVES